MKKSRRHTETERPIHYTRVEDCVDDTLCRVGRRIVLGLPLGIGKPNHIANEFFRRAAEDPTLSLDIVTALTLSRRHASSDLEQRLLGPINERLFGNYPELAYHEARQRGTVPSNIRIHEFFLSPGTLLGNADAQQRHVNSNYTHVVRDVLGLGLNVLAQLVAAPPFGEDARVGYSLSTNTDLSLQLVDRLRHRDRSAPPIAILAQVNEQLPFMYGQAIVAPEIFDGIVNAPSYQFDLCGPPKLEVGPADHAIGLRASTLIPDGGSLQIGIGSLADAVAHSLKLRHQDNRAYRRLLDSIGAGAAESPQGDDKTHGPFERGLYAPTEMLGDAILELIRAGVISRHVYAEPELQEALNETGLPDQPSLELIAALRARGAIENPLRTRDVEWLVQIGILKHGLRHVADELRLNDLTAVNDLDDPTCRDLLETALGSALYGGHLASVAFLLGDRRFYAALRELPPAERRRLQMTSVAFVNELYGDERLKRAQRSHARFLNTAMIVTLSGAVVSDQLEDGRVVSGVGGQYNFVAMAHALENARSIILLRSWRRHSGEVTSNVLWKYGHATIPNHLRDVVVTEYGVADLRGQPASETIERLLAVTDSRFQARLVSEAQRSGKLPKNYRLPDRFRNNTPEHLERALGRVSGDRLLPRFPLGTELTDVEADLIAALQSLESWSAAKRPLVPNLAGVRAGIRSPKSAEKYLERLALASPTSVRDRILRRLLVYALSVEGRLDSTQLAGNE